MNTRCVFLLVGLLFSAACIQADHAFGDGDWRKIEFDLSQLDEDGLRGPPDGKVSVAYEFRIPNDEALKARVRAIDSTVQFMPGSPGRIGAGAGEILCIGSTHQPNHRDVLLALAALPEVERIVECHFE
jgi:hypothetical protein